GAARVRGGRGAAGVDVHDLTSRARRLLVPGKPARIGLVGPQRKRSSMMGTRSRFGMAIAGLAVGLMALLGAALPASASPGQVVKVPVVGAQFTCTDGTTFTAVTADAVVLFHESTHPQGGDHVTRTVAPSNGTLTHS